MLRQATHADITTLLQMMEEFYVEGDHALDHDQATLAFTKLLDHSDYGMIWLHESDSEANGYVVFTVRFAMEYGGLVGSIDDLYVRPAVRRKGVGKQLLESVLVECHDRNLHGLDVEVAPENLGAQSLYSSLGLQPHGDGRIHMAFRFGGEF